MSPCYRVCIYICCRRQHCEQVKCNSCEGVSPIAIHISLLPMAFFHGHVCSFLVQVCMFRSHCVSTCQYMCVHWAQNIKEQCYNDSVNLWFTVICNHVINGLLLIPTQATLWSFDHRLHSLCWYCHHYAAVVDMCVLYVHLYVYSMCWQTDRHEGRVCIGYIYRVNYQLYLQTPIYVRKSCCSCIGLIGVCTYMCTCVSTCV